jgi:hypothetical protein
MIQTPLNRSRSDKFILVLDLPLALKNHVDPVIQDTFKIDQVQFSVYGSPVPAISIPSIDVAFGSQVYKTSTFARPAYDPLQIKFLVDNGYKNYWILWNWLNVLNDFKDSTTAAHSISENGKTIKNPMSNYTSFFNIYGLDEFNNKIIAFKYTNAFPTSLSEISYSNQEPNEINSAVTFAFNQLDIQILKDVNQVSC